MSTDATISQRVDSLDQELFSLIESSTTAWDRRSLLALHSATAQTLGTFSYLEVGSHLGGSLQAVMRDPRCSQVVSIDPRPTDSPDARGPNTTYEDNSTARMLGLLGRLPGVDMGKLHTFEHSTETLEPDRLPVRPDYCFIDAEHTDEAVLRDARFCSKAIGGVGVIAFHDYTIVGQGIRSFLREAWSEVSHAIAFNGNVFAVELGGSGILRSESVTRVVSSRWHSVTWRVVSAPKSTPTPFFLAWSTMPAIDLAVAHTKRRLRRAAQMRPPRRPRTD